MRRSISRLSRTSPYTAVGVNFTAVMATEDPRTFIITRFLRDGPWNSDDLRARDASFRITYASDPGELHVTIDVGKVKKNKEEPKPVIRVQGNYHTGKLTKGNETSEAVGYIQLYEERWADFCAKVNLMFELGDTKA